MTYTTYISCFNWGICCGCASWIVVYLANRAWLTFWDFFV